MLKIKIVNINEEWDSKLMQFKDWNIFQTSIWIKAYKAKYFPHSGITGLLFYQNELLAGILPVIVLKKYLLKIGGSPIRHSLTPYMGCSIQNVHFPDYLNSIIEFMTLTNTNILSITHGELPAYVSNYLNDYQHNIHTTSILYLNQSEDEIWKNIHPKTKNQIRKGEKSSFLISDEYNQQILSDYLNLRIDMYKRQNMNYKKSNEFLVEILSTLPRESFRLLSIKHEGKLISAAIFMLYNQICYYWDGVSNSGYNKLCPNNVLQWNIIKWAKANGFRWYDLGGTNTPSIAHFKYGYGGIEKKYFSIQVFNPKILSIAWKYKKKISKIKNPRLINK